MADTIRHWLALLTLLTLPPAFLYWYLIHPFAAAWRKLGRPAAYLIVFVICASAGYGLWQVREPFLSVDYGFNPWLSAIGLALYVTAIFIEIQCRKHLKLHILVGSPELAKDGPGKLLQEGIYARIRHPRYMSLAFGMTGMAMFMNYQSVYLLILASFPTLYGLVLIEERELRQRFGDAYVDYSRRVPRFIPRRGGS